MDLFDGFNLVVDGFNYWFWRVLEGVLTVLDGFDGFGTGFGWFQCFLKVFWVLKPTSGIFSLMIWPF